ncbi:solute carrier family 17 (sodium phosphate) member 3 [Cricetulus griseus]
MATVVELKPIREQSEDVLGDKKTPPRKVPSLCSMRYGIALLTHFSNFTLIAQNSIISITMVAMVNNTDYQPHLNSSTEGLPADLNGDQHEAAKDLSAKAPVYNWSPQTQGFIFSSAQYGMMLMQGPAGFLAGKIGTKKVVGIALLASSVLTLCIPVATNLGLAFLLATRAVQGLTQGTGYGGQFALWQRWAPPNERSRLCSIALSVPGFCSFRYGLAIFLHFCNIVIMAQRVCLNLTMVAMVNSTEPPHLPNGSAMEIRDDVKNGLLSSLSYLLAYICGIVAGQLSDFFLSRKIFSTANVRKLFTTIGILCPVIFTMCLLYLSNNFYSTIVFLTLANSTLSFSFSGHHINALDIAPRYYGFLKAVTALIGMMGGLISSAVAGLILNQHVDSKNRIQVAKHSGISFPAKPSCHPSDQLTNSNVTFYGLRALIISATSAPLALAAFVISTATSATAPQLRLSFSDPLVISPFFLLPAHPALKWERSNRDTQPNLSTRKEQHKTLQTWVLPGKLGTPQDGVQLGRPEGS